MLRYEQGSVWPFAHAHMMLARRHEFGDKAHLGVEASGMTILLLQEAGAARLLGVLGAVLTLLLACSTDAGECR